MGAWTALGMGLLVGDLPGGGSGELWVGADTLVDVYPTPAATLTINAGGALLAFDPEAMEVTGVRVPDVSLRGFVESDDGVVRVFDRAGQTFRVDALELSLVEDGPGFPAGIHQAWFLDGAWSAVTPGPDPLQSASATLHDAQGHHPIPQATRWFRIGDDLWWTHTAGEFGGGFGVNQERLGGHNTYWVTDSPDGVRIGGGLCHFICRATVFGLQGDVFYDHNAGFLWTAPAKQPASEVLWMDVYRGHVHVITSRGDHFVGTRDLTVWQRLGHLGRFKHARWDHLGRLWVATNTGLWRVDRAISERAKPFGPPRSVGMTWAADRLWAWGEGPGVSDLTEGGWRQTVPAPIRNRHPTAETHESGHTIDAAGAVTWWRTVASGIWRVYRLQEPPDGVRFLLGPASMRVHVSQGPDGQPLALATDCQEVPGLPCVRVDSYALDRRSPQWIRNDLLWYDGDWWTVRRGRAKRARRPRGARWNWAHGHPLANGGWAMIDGERVSLFGPRGRVRDTDHQGHLNQLMCDTRGRLWSMRTTHVVDWPVLSVLEGGRFRSVDGIPYVGDTHAIHPLPDGRVAVSTDLGMLLLDLPAPDDDDQVCLRPSVGGG